MATLLVDWLNDGTIPQSKTAGNWTPSAFNTGKFRFTLTFAAASTGSPWRPAGLTYWGLLTTNDVNGGGVWLRWDGTSTHTIICSGTDDGVDITNATKAFTWTAGQSVTFVIDLSTATATITVSGAATGNGVTSGWTRENLFGGTALHYGTWGSGSGYQLPASSTTTSDIDDGNDSVTANAAATGNGTRSNSTSAVAVAAAGAATGSGSVLAALAAVAIAASGAATGNGSSLDSTATATFADRTGAGAATGNGSRLDSSGTVGSPSAAGAATGNGTRSDSSATVAVVANGDGRSGGSRLASANFVPVALGIGTATIQQRVNALNPPTGTLDTPAISTSTGSAFMTGVARGIWSTAPTQAYDNQSNVYTNIGQHAYTGFPTSETAHGLKINGVGNASHIGRADWGNIGGAGDEVTVFLLELLGVNLLQDQSWVERAHGAFSTIVSNPVRTTAPALLVAVIWGNGPTGQAHTFTPGSGWTKITAASAETDLSGNGYIQCTVMYRLVTDAGSYTASASGINNEGGQFYLYAYQATTGVEANADIRSSRSVLVATALHTSDGNVDNRSSGTRLEATASVAVAAAGAATGSGSVLASIGAVAISAAGGATGNGTRSSATATAVLTGAGEAAGSGTRSDGVASVAVSAAGAATGSGSVLDSSAIVSAFTPAVGDGAATGNGTQTAATASVAVAAAGAATGNGSRSDSSGTVEFTGAVATGETRSSGTRANATAAVTGLVISPIPEVVSVGLLDGPVTVRLIG